MEAAETVAMMLPLLRPKERRIIEQVNLGTRTLESVAVDFGLTESRACQIRNMAYERMRGMLSEGQAG